MLVLSPGRVSSVVPTGISVGLIVAPANAMSRSSPKLGPTASTSSTSPGTGSCEADGAAVASASTAFTDRSSMGGRNPRSCTWSISAVASGFQFMALSRVQLDAPGRVPADQRSERDRIEMFGANDAGRARRWANGHHGFRPRATIAPVPVPRRTGEPKMHRPTNRDDRCHPMRLPVSASCVPTASRRLASEPSEPPLERPRPRRSRRGASAPLGHPWGRFGRARVSC